jgi:hypothetical protein
MGGGAVPCTVDIQGVSSPDLYDVPAGSTLRVRGVLTGASQPVASTWAWTVKSENTRASLMPTTPDAQDPSVIEFPTTATVDSYDINVTFRGPPTCMGSAVARSTLTPSGAYLLRVLPPLDRPELPPCEQNIRVQSGTPLPGQSCQFVPIPVLLDPQNAVAQAIPSYVLITSPQHSWSRQGATDAGPFMTALPGNDAAPGSLYDVLVVPLDSHVAPALFPSRTAGGVAALSVVLDPGLSIAGTLGVEGGSSAAPGAMVILHADGLPSTVGDSDAAGAFSLLARSGRFSAAIVPAPGDTLPEAHVGADAASGIDLSMAASPPFALKFTWRRDLGASAFTVHLVGASGPATMTDVRLDSDDASLTDVGTLAFGDGSGASQTFMARGAVHRAATTDATGSVSFSGLPRAVYQLTAVPPATSADGVTTAAIDLSANATPAPKTINLLAKVRATGVLSNAPAGTRIIVLDDRPLAVPGYALAPAQVSSSGAFSLSLDAGRAYHLVAYPPDDQMASRVPLGAVATKSVPLALAGSKFPKMLGVSGQIKDESGAALGNAQVQIFCLGAGPDCIDPTLPASKDPLPLMESVTDAGGNFELQVPDPALQ